MPRRKRGSEAEAAAEAAAAGSNDEEVSGGEDEAEDSGDSSDEADLEMAQADGAEKELQVEFIFTDPAEEDTPYVRSLLAGGSLCTATGADAAGLAATVANQVEVGTMIKADGALFGFLSTVSLQRHRADPSVGRLISLLGSDRVEDGPLRQRLAGLLAPSGGANVGLLLSERMVNTPVQLVPHAVESLHLDLGWAAANAEPAAERASLTFEWLVLLAHVTLDTQAGAESGGAGGSGGGSGGGGGGKRSKKQKRAAGLSLLGRASFARVEEELLAKGAEAVSLVRGGLPAGGQLLLMLLRPEALAAAVPAMRAVMCD